MPLDTPEATKLHSYPVNPDNLVNPVNKTRFGLRCDDYDPNATNYRPGLPITDSPPPGSRGARRRIRRRQRYPDG